MLLWRGKATGFWLAPAVLTAMVLLGAGIVSIQLVLAARGLDASFAVAIGVAVMTAAELVALAVVLRAFRVD